MKTKRGGRSGEQGSALSLRQRATVHRRAAEVLQMLAQIEDSLRCYGEAWFAGASEEDQREALVDLEKLDCVSFALEASLALFPLPGGAR